MYVPLWATAEVTVTIFGSVSMCGEAHSLSEALLNKTVWCKIISQYMIHWVNKVVMTANQDHLSLTLVCNQLSDTCWKLISSNEMQHVIYTNLLTLISFRPLNGEEVLMTHLTLSVNADIDRMCWNTGLFISGLICEALRRRKWHPSQIVHWVRTGKVCQHCKRLLISRCDFILQRGSK